MCGWCGVGPPVLRVGVRSVADREASLDEAGQLGLVDEGHGGVLRGDAAASVGVEDGLVAAEAEAARALAWSDLLRGAEGPQAVGRAQYVQGVPMTAYHCCVCSRQSELVESGMQVLVGIGEDEPGFDLEAARTTDHDQADAGVTLQCLQQRASSGGEDRGVGDRSLHGVGHVMGCVARLKSRESAAGQG